jgi:hypothetical protein
VPTWFGMERVAPGIYVEKTMTSADRAEVTRIVGVAKEQLGRYYGKVVSSPTLYFCASDEQFHAFGGSAQRGFTFLSWASVLPKRGTTVPIVTHEWSHAELSARIGVWRMRAVPQWFDDGVAITASEEPSHAESVYQEALRTGVPIPALTDLVTLRQWSRTAQRYGDPKLNPHHLGVVYSTAGHEVRPWFERVGTAGLNRLIARVASGEDFATCYATAKPASPQ